MVMSPEIKRFMEKKSAHLLSHGHFHLGFGCLLFHWLLFWAWLLNKCCLASSADLLLQFQVLLPVQSTQNQNQNWGLEEKKWFSIWHTQLKSKHQMERPLGSSTAGNIAYYILTDYSHQSFSQIHKGPFFFVLFVPWVNELMKKKKT